MAEINDDEMFSMSYKDARDKYAVGVGNNKYFMSESDFNKGKERINKKNAEKQAADNNPNKEEKPKENTKPKEQSLVANQFGVRKEKTWNDVKSEYKTPEERANYLNTATDYTPGELTKKGMEADGYVQGADGKWVLKPKTTGTTSETKTPTPTSETKTTGTTTDDALNGVEGITKEDPKAKGFVDGVTNEDGSVNEQKALNAMSQYEQKLAEMGAGSFDEDGKFVFKDTTKKGWEDWATMLSVGASVIGIAMGVPVMPINFRKLTNKDEKDAKIREFQKQYADIMAGNAAKVKDVESSKEAGKVAKANEEDINAYSKYKEDVGAYEAKSTIDTDSEKELIDAQSQSRLKELQAQAVNNENLLKLEQAHDKEMAKLSSDLSTASAKELTAYSKTGWVVDYIKELQAQDLSNKDIALAIAGLGGTTPTQMGLKNAESIVGMVTDTADTVLDHIPFLGKGKGKGKK